MRPFETSWAKASLSHSVSPKAALLRVDEAAAILKVSSKTVRRLLAQGDLKAVRVGRLVRIPSSEIDRLIAGGDASGGDFWGLGRP